MKTSLAYLVRAIEQGGIELSAAMAIELWDAIEAREHHAFNAGRAHDGSIYFGMTGNIGWEFQSFEDYKAKRGSIGF